MTEEMAAHRSKIILGVDDQPENLLLLKTVVEGAGYTFVGTKAGAECVTLCNRLTPRLILLDIQMPDMDGMQTCQRLREMSAMVHVPIAFLTGRKTADDVTRGIRAGGNDFIVKPFDPVKLTERLKYWTHRHV
jgi:two-component system sensor histidine kinase/response regulator